MTTSNRIDVRAARAGEGKRVRTILSIDGGGVRGIIPALVLADIEHRTGKAIAELFDLIAGTSTGGILALGVTIPDGDGRPKFSAAQMVELYMRRGQEIFHRVAWRQALSWIRGPAYSPAGLERVLAEYAGDTMLSEAVTGLLVTSWELRTRTAWFFRRAQARTDQSKDMLMRDIGRATSAAPTYFPPMRLAADDGNGYYALADGGLFANNPGMAAWVDTHEGVRHNQDVFMVSVGTGSVDDPISYAQARAWGKLSWAQPVIGIVFDGASDTVDYQLSYFLSSQDYYRFQPTIPKANREMDDASQANLDALTRLATAMIKARSADLDVLCGRLLELSNDEHTGTDGP